MQKFFGYVNHQLYIEACNYQSYKTKRYIRNLTEYCNLQIELQNEVTHSS